MTTTEIDVREYELAFLLNTEEAVKAVEGVLTSSGAEIVSIGPLRTINLAYPIKKQETAFWGFLTFRVLPEKLAEIKKALHFLPQLLRFLLITPPVAVQETRWRGATAERPEIIAEPPKTEHSRPSAGSGQGPPILSNEALEKQIEEILS